MPGLLYILVLRFDFVMNFNAIHLIPPKGIVIVVLCKIQTDLPACWSFLFFLPALQLQLLPVTIFLLPKLYLSV